MRDLLKVFSMLLALIVFSSMYSISWSVTQEGLVDPEEFITWNIVYSEPLGKNVFVIFQNPDPNAQIKEVCSLLGIIKPPRIEAGHLEILGYCYTLDKIEHYFVLSDGGVYKEVLRLTQQKKKTHPDIIRSLKKVRIQV